MHLLNYIQACYNNNRLEDAHKLWEIFFYINRLESHNDDLIRMIKEKELELIRRGEIIKNLKLEISQWSIDVQKQDLIINQLQERIEDLLKYVTI